MVVVLVVMAVDSVLAFVCGDGRWMLRDQRLPCVLRAGRGRSGVEVHFGSSLLC